ncbi:MAG: PhnD/SsuA/transferrin family substrate-binding protein [Pseudomonadota bacterium]
MTSGRFISCGMYAPNPPLQQAWQQLFDQFYNPLEQPANLQSELVFDGSETVLRDPSLFFGHTCGYPLMTSLQDHLLPFCVPVFDVPGCDGNRYSSLFIVSKDSDIHNLLDSRDKRLAINHIDSNSGMNVLRYALARQDAKPGFFSETTISGGHWQSLEAVANGLADIAAIDCVSLQLAFDFNPGLKDQIRIIEQSEKTGALPFVLPRSQYETDYCQQLTDKLNEALLKMPRSTAEKLHLRGFESVDLSHYESILNLKSEAEKSGYPKLN